MDYVGNIIRPPSEAYSLIIQVTVGCSHNMCTFCGTYKSRKFYIKDTDLIKRDIDEASKFGGSFRKAFLTDGDVLILPTETLLHLINYIRKKIPSIKRVGVYGNTKSILKKSKNELMELKDAGLGIVYHGIESGNKEVLRRIRKGAFPHKMIESANKITETGILLSQTVLLGIGGRELSINHAVDTGKVLSEMSPHFASALTLIVLPNTDLYKDYKSGKFILPDKFELLNELKIIIENMDVKRECFFASNHASNYVAVKAKLPREKDKTVALLEKIISSGDKNILRPEFMRGL